MGCNFNRSDNIAPRIRLCRLTVKVASNENYVNTTTVRSVIASNTIDQIWICILYRIQYNSIMEYLIKYFW